MIKNIVFDLGGVIVPLSRVSCIRAFNDVVGYKNFGDVLSSYRQLGFFDRFETGHISAKKFRQIIRSNASPDENGNPRNITDREIDYSLNCFLKEIPQERIDTLIFYRGDYRLFLLSNTNPIGMKYCRKLFLDKGYDIKDIFEKQYLSYLMKMAKPSEEIFLKMLKDAEILPQETLYIDDAPANIAAGRELGFHTILFNPREDLYDTISEFFQRQQR